MNKAILLCDWEDGGMKKGETVIIESPSEQWEWDEFMGCPLYRARSRTGYNRLPQRFAQIVKEEQSDSREEIKPLLDKEAKLSKNVKSIFYKAVRKTFKK